MLTKINFAFLGFDTVVNDPYHNVYNKYRINCEYFFFCYLFCLYTCRSSEGEIFSQNKTFEWNDCVYDLLQILNLWM